jgi:hypothetical protein
VDRFGEQLAEVEFAFGMVRTVVRHLEADTLSGDQAMQMAELLSGFEPVVASGVALLTPRVTSDGTYAKSGFTSAQDWLGAATGTSAGAAKSRLAAAEKASRVPKIAEAMHEGELSGSQIDLLARTEAAAPGSAATLLDMVDKDQSHQELSDQAARMKAAARSKEAEHQRRARVHASRSFRWRQGNDGGISGSFFCDEVAWARVAPTLEAETTRRWKAAGADSGETLEAHRLDAFIDLLGRRPGRASTGGGTGTTGATGTTGTTGATVGEVAGRPEVLVIVDAEALRRGTTVTGEICEIEGIGPVPVEAAIELLGEGAMQILVKEGVDIRTVTSCTRVLAQKTLAALIVRDRTCATPGCGKHLGLQVDHCFVDYIDDGPTTYDNLARLCPTHHDMKTYGDWELTRQGGTWGWIAPKNPPTARRIAAARRLAVAKAKAGITSKSKKSTRNQPRQT